MVSEERAEGKKIGMRKKEKREREREREKVGGTRFEVNKKRNGNECIRLPGCYSCTINLIFLRLNKVPY